MLKGGGSMIERDIPAWKRRFYRSRGWQECRKVVIDRQHGLCADCMARGEYKPIAEVHHEEFLTEENVGDPTVSLNPKKCVGLCTECHNRRHDKGFKRDEKPGRVWFDADGNPHVRV